MKKKSFTLIEVIVGALILATTFAGLFATFVGVRRYVNRANRRLVTANLAKRALNDIYREVDQGTWDGAGLALTAGVPAPLLDYDIEGIDYGNAGNPNEYTVGAVAGQQYRQVTVTINYTPD